MRERLLGLSRSVPALETGVSQAGEPVTTFDEEPTAPTALVAAGTILVVHAEGTGVPLVPTPLICHPCAWARGSSAASRKRPS